MFINLLVALSFTLFPDPVTHLNATPAVMVAIAECESHQQQFSDDGSVVGDYATGDHIGVYQISKKLWAKRAHDMGWNIETPSGNIAMGLWLYYNYGTSPWLASKHCWGGSEYS